MNAYDIEFKGLDGADLPLSAYGGRAILVVNVASACGFTPQYAPMQALADEFGDEGPVILGVPCNDFGAQEPRSADTIAHFCETRYGVTFPITEKVEILNATSRHPFYAWIASELGEDALPKWNFHKYVIGRDGSLVASFASRVAPDAPEVRAALGSVTS
jgi:glutathione peroxidase